MSEAGAGTGDIDPGLERLFVLTGNRVAPAQPISHLDMVAALRPPDPDAQDESARILHLCQAGPRSVVELSACLSLPVTVVAILLEDLAAARSVTIDVSPAGAIGPARPATDSDLLRRVLHGLRKLG